MASWLLPAIDFLNIPRDDFVFLVSAYDGSYFLLENSLSTL